MSNLTLFSSGAALPAYLQRAELNEVTKALMGGGMGGKRISIKGGVFRMIVDGKEVAQNDDRAMNVIVVNAAPKTSRTFYLEKFDESAEKKPAAACWSSDSETPDKSIKNPQHSNCAQCPQNIKGSGEGDSRACRYSQRIAVVLENDADGEVYGMQLPATSIFGTDANKMPLQQYVRYLGSHGVNIDVVVTEMRFDTSVANPKLTFKAIRPLEEAEYEALQGKGQTPEAINAITMTVSQQDKVEGSADGTQPAPDPVATPKPAPTPVAATPKPAPKPAPTPVAATPKPTVVATPKTTGFKVTKTAVEAPVDAEPVVRTAPAPAAVTASVADILSDWVDD